MVSWQRSGIFSLGLLLGMGVAIAAGRAIPLSLGGNGLGRSAVVAQQVDQERSQYRVLDLSTDGRVGGAALGSLTAEHPGVLLLQAFGSTGEFPGFEGLEIRYQGGESKTGAIATFTRTGLLDDSLNGYRYRVELVRRPETQLWQINWVGYQVRCYPGRGHQQWSAASCN